jgi:predicted metal-dependent hydrolase
MVMGTPAADYDERYLAGVVLFNRGDYFDAHEVWEDLWMDCPAAERRFYQSLIQAAVALYHWGNGNRAGAARLFHSGRRYMGPFRPTFRGLDADAFWRQVEEALADVLTSRDREGAADDVNHPPPDRCGSPDSRPRIALDPSPARWPDPDEVRHE